MAAVGRDADAAVVADDPAVGVEGVDPDVVVVPAGLVEAFALHRAAAVERHGQAGGDEGEFVRAVGRGGHAGVVEGPGDQVQVAADEAPRVAAIVRTPEDAGERIGGGEVAVRTRLDQGVEPVRIVGRHREPDLAQGRRRQAGAFEGRPGRAAVAGTVEAAARAAAGAAGGADLDLPGRGVDGPRVIRGESEVDGPGVRVDEQDVDPGRAAVRGAKDAAPRLVAFLWPVGVAERRDQGGVGVVGMHDDAADAAGLVEPEVFEAVAAVRGAVDAVADRDVAADEALAGADPDHVRVGGGDRDRADRSGFLAVEDRFPVDAAVVGSPKPAGGGAGVVHALVAGHSGYGRDPVADGADVAEGERIEKPRCEVDRLLRGGGAAEQEGEYRAQRRLRHDGRR